MEAIEMLPPVLLARRLVKRQIKGEMRDGLRH